MEINLKYKGKNHVIKCQKSDVFKEVCENFVKKYSLNIDKIFFIFKGTKINLDENAYVEQQFNLESIDAKNNKKKIRIEVLVYDESPFIITFFHEGTQIFLEAEEDEKMLSIFKRFCTKAKANISVLNFLYGGNILSKENNYTLIQIANSLDKFNRKMAIYVNSGYSNNNNNNVNYNNFIVNNNNNINNNNYNVNNNINSINNVNNDINSINNNNNYNNNYKIENQSNIISNDDDYIIDEEKISPLVGYQKKDFSQEQYAMNDEPIIQDIILDNNEYKMYQQPEDNEFYEKKAFYLQTSIVLFIQLFAILLITTLGFLFDFNKTLIDWKASPVIKYVIFILSIFAFIIIVKMNLNDNFNKNIICMSIFHVLEPIIISYHSFLMSERIDYKYIIIEYSLIAMEILSLGIYVLFFHIHKLQHFLFSSSLISLIGLILFSIFWIKELLPIVYVTIFWLLTLGYYLLWHHFALKMCKLDEYLFSAFIFDYSFIFGLAYGVIWLFRKSRKAIKNRIEDYDSHRYDQFLRLYGIFFGQVIIIIIIYWISISLGYIDFLNEYDSAAQPMFAFTFLGCIIFCSFPICYRKEPSSKLWYIYSGLYIPIVFIFLTFISKYESDPNEGHILILLFLIFFSLLSIIIFNLLIHTEKIIYNAIYSLVIDSIVIVLFHFLWLNDEQKLIVCFVEAVVISIYLPLCQFLTRSYNDDGYLAFSLIFFNYGVFYVINCLLYGIVILCINYYKNRRNDD